MTLVHKTRGYEDPQKAGAHEAAVCVRGGPQTSLPLPYLVPVGSTRDFLIADAIGQLSTIVFLNVI